jgi:hypothetical protein
VFLKLAHELPVTTIEEADDSGFLSVDSEALPGS